MLELCITNDKHKKWLTLIGGFLVHFALGSLYSAPNMGPYIISYLREYRKLDVRYSDLSYMNTPVDVFLSLASVLSGYLIFKNIITTKQSILIGLIIFNLSPSLTYFTINQSYFLTILTYSVLYALGYGFVYIPPISLAMKWFKNSKGKSSAFILFGLGSGSILFNQLETLYINPKNYSPDKPYSPKYPDEKYFSQVDLLERIPKCFLILALTYFICQSIGFCLIFEKMDNANTEREPLLSNSINNSQEVEQNHLIEINSIGVKYESPDEGLTLIETLKTKEVYYLGVVACLSSVSINMITLNFKIFGQTFIHDDKFLALCGSISAILNASGRLFWGTVIDNMSFKICLLTLNTLMISLISTIYSLQFIPVISKEIYLVWLALIYFIFTGYTIIQPIGWVKCFGLKNFNSVYSLKSLFCVPGSFVIGYLNLIYYKIGWFNFFMIGCAFLMISSVFGVLFGVKKSNGNDI